MDIINSFLTAFLSHAVICRHTDHCSERCMGCRKGQNENYILAKVLASKTRHEIYCGNMVSMTIQTRVRLEYHPGLFILCPFSLSLQYGDWPKI